MASPSSNLLLAGGLGLLIGIGGGATGALLVDRTPAPAVPPAIQAESGTPASAIAALTAELRSVREALEARSSPTSTPGESRAPATDPAAERLERAVTRLTEALESPRASVVGAIPARSVEHENLKPKQTARLQELRAMDPAARSQAYLFWSLQDVLDRFGRPDGFWPQENQQLTLHYQLEDGGAVDILLTGGLVFVIASW